MKFLPFLGALCVAMPCAAGTWSHQTLDGVRTATITNGDTNEIYVMCDAGINAPITSINFIIDGVSPDPNSSLMLDFGDTDPIYAKTDTEGGLGTISAADASQFRKIVKLMKTKSKVTVRIFTGATETFALRGSSKAIGTDCNPDFDRFQLALQ